MNNNNYPHKCLNVLGNELRIKIIKILLEEDKSVKEICETTKSEQSKVSHSLKQLKKCNFVDFRKNGKERKYFLKSEIFKKNSEKSILEMIEEHAKKYCEMKK